MSIKLDEVEIEKVKVHMDIISQYQSDFEKMRFALVKSQETLMGYLNNIVSDRDEDISKNYQLNLNDFTLEPSVNNVSSNGSGPVESVGIKNDETAVENDNNHMDP